jgi:iron(III) transport system substrate-binding protein
VSAQEAPKTWEDLADGKWKGRKIILEARLVPFAMLGTEIGKAKAMDLAKKLLAQDPIIIQGGTTALNALAGGQAPIAIGVYAYAVDKLKKKGAPIDWVPVSPLPLLTSALGVVKTAPHPNAARFFAGWMGTIEGQKIIYEYSGQATLVGKNAYGPEAERLKTARPKIILETDQNFAAILDVQRELGKLAGALR